MVQYKIHLVLNIVNLYQRAKMPLRVNHIFAATKYHKFVLFFVCKVGLLQHKKYKYVKAQS